MVPVLLAAWSPYLAFRQPVYIVAGFAGIAALALMLVQPLLASLLLPGMSAARGRRLHVWVGTAVVGLVIIHVGGLWITSPPDVIDALLLRSPTPFSAWGVLAMVALFGAGMLALARGWIGVRAWRVGHTLLVATAVIATVPHAWLIEGAMEPFSKAVLLAAALFTLALAVRRRQVWRVVWRRRRLERG